MAKEEHKSNAVAALNEYVLLGRSGLRVSPVCLGTMTFGDQWGFGVNKEESKKVFDLYRSKGGNFYDTANVRDNWDFVNIADLYERGKRAIFGRISFRN
jgi:aryl-alcohol dehydrogenase-like predicted oxidoreductase